MSSLTLFNSSGSMPFLALSAVFSFVISAIFMGIVTMWMTLKQKISDEISARDTEVKTFINVEITKIKNEINTKNADDLSSCDGSITAEIERLLTDVYKKLSTEVNTKIANELSARLSEINSTFTAKLDRINNDLNNKLNEEVNAGFGKINTELNSKLSAEIDNFKARDAGYATEAQKIFARLFNIEEACRNDFDRITSLEKGAIDSINDLYKKINQCYAEVRSHDFDQYSESNESEVSNRSRESGNSTPSSSSSNSSLDENRNRFKRVFNSKKEIGDTMDYMFETVRREIRHLTGEKIGKSTVESFIMVKGVQNTT